MKAIVYRKFGSTDELKLEEVPKPVPKENEVLIKVKTASVNSWDYDLVIGRPYVYRLLFGFFRPRYNIIGIDVAGTVEAVGKNIKRFEVGDEVFGDISASGFGAFAEYACAPEHLIAHKLKEMSFEEAAAIPHAGVLALQGLRMNGKVTPGQKVLINGAGGGVGTIGLQLAKKWGAEVTCVDKGNKLEMLRTLGADYVIDYTKEDFTDSGKLYDLIIDPVAKRPIKHYARALRRNGSFVLIGGSISTIFQVFTMGRMMGKRTGKKIGFLPHQPNAEDLKYFNDFYQSGIVKPVIDRSFELYETARAVQYLGDGKSMGKLVINI